MHLKEELIRKLFLGTCNREELEQLLQLVKDDPSEVGPDVMTELFEQLASSKEVDAHVSNRIFDLIEKKKKEADTTQAAGPKLTARRPLFIQISRIAAVALLLIIGTWAVIEWNGRQPVEVQTAYNEIKELVLPDGSKVVLNGNSTLQYPKSWKEGADRKVNLYGEAYFEVEKKPATQAKFQVITQDLTVEVLGTVFNVNTRKSETSVFLEEGKVRVNLDHEVDKVINLEPGEIMQYSATSKKLTTPKKIAKELEVNWRTGNMEFHETPLKEILEEIAHANKLEFVIREENLAEETFTLVLPIEDMGVTMTILSKSTGLSLQKEGETYIIARDLPVDKKE